MHLTTLVRFFYYINKESRTDLCYDFNSSQPDEKTQLIGSGFDINIRVIFQLFISLS